MSNLSFFNPLNELEIRKNSTFLEKCEFTYKALKGNVQLKTPNNVEDQGAMRIGFVDYLTLGAFKIAALAVFTLILPLGWARHVSENNYSMQIATLSYLLSIPFWITFIPCTIALAALVSTDMLFRTLASAALLLALLPVIAIWHACDTTQTIHDESNYTHAIWLACDTTPSQANNNGTMLEQDDAKDDLNFLRV